MTPQQPQRPSIRWRITPLRTLLMLLSALGILASILLGGYALLGVVQAFMPPRLVDTHAIGGSGEIALLSLVVGLFAAGLFMTNTALFRSVRGQRPLGRKNAVRLLGGVDLVVALVSLALGAVSWLLAVVVFAIFAGKGVLTLLWAASAPTAGSSGPSSAE